MANKKYIAIITEETDNFSLDYLTDNPWEGNLREIAKGNTASELIDNAGDSEGMFYQLYETGKGKRIGYGVFNYDAIEEDIKRSEMGYAVIDGHTYMVMTVSKLAEFTVSQLNFDAFSTLTDDGCYFINCDYCVIDGGEDGTIEEIKENVTSWMGIKSVDTGFDNHDLDIISDYYGGGALSVACLTCNMTWRECVDAIIHAISETINEFGETAHDDMLLFVEVLNENGEMKSDDK